MRLVTLLVELILFLHVIACLIYYIVNKNKQWLPISEQQSKSLYIVDNYVYIYSTAIYYALRVFTVNDIGPTVLVERLMFSIMAVIAIIYNATIFGNIFSIIKNANTISDAYQE